MGSRREGEGVGEGDREGERGKKKHSYGSRDMAAMFLVSVNPVLAFLASHAMRYPCTFPNTKCNPSILHPFLVMTEPFAFCAAS